ncbi:putative metallopeptidase [Bacillus subtilis]|uniref:putative metallopeptidase n=1 Tax=Bacillus subtilis TaxID=1423 RepID=UPI003983987F
MVFVGFEESKELRQLAESIIDENHPHLKDAKQQIGFYLREGNSKWAGKAKKCTAFERHMTDYMLFVFINKAAWETMPEEQRAALVDHELCHFTREEWEEPDPKDPSKWVTVYGAATDPDSWGIREHDVEEFSEIIERHGLWDTGIETFAEAVRAADHQMTISDVQRLSRVK